MTYLYKGLGKIHETHKTHDDQNQGFPLGGDIPSGVERVAVEVRPVHMPPMTEAELEAEAIRELERLERARNRKRSGFVPKRRGAYADHR